jgi:hypothetical protein
MSYEQQVNALNNLPIWTIPHRSLTKMPIPNVAEHCKHIWFNDDQEKARIVRNIDERPTIQHLSIVERSTLAIAVKNLMSLHIDSSYGLSCLICVSVNNGNRYIWIW